MQLRALSYQAHSEKNGETFSELLNGFKHIPGISRLLLESPLDENYPNIGKVWNLPPNAFISLLLDNQPNAMILVIYSVYEWHYYKTWMEIKKLCSWYFYQQRQQWYY